MAEATLNTPETQPSAAKIFVVSTHNDVLRQQAIITFRFRNSGDTATIRQAAYVAENRAAEPPLPAVTEYTSFMVALLTPRAGESGGQANRFQYRVLGWLADNNKFTDANGNPIAVTVTS